VPLWQGRACYGRAGLLVGHPGLRRRCGGDALAAPWPRPAARWLLFVLRNAATVAMGSLRALALGAAFVRGLA